MKRALIRRRKDSRSRTGTPCYQAGTDALQYEWLSFLDTPLLPPRRPTRGRETGAAIEFGRLREEPRLTGQVACHVRGFYPGIEIFG